MQAQSYIPFTKEMKKEYTILMPTMLPRHFELIGSVLGTYGYKMELLKTAGQKVVDAGLRYVHNDACYPAVLVIGQFLEAITSGRYDPHKVALILFQTGGGCRASNYISLLRKALARLPWKPTVVLISQRVSSIRHADQIIVLDHGRAVGIGTHKELMQTCTVYQEIARSQLSAEELEREVG